MQKNKSKMVHLVDFHAFIARRMSEQEKAAPVPSIWATRDILAPLQNRYSHSFDFTDQNDKQAHHLGRRSRKISGRR